MRFRMVGCGLAVVLGLGASPTPAAAIQEAGVDALIRAQMEELHIPGLAAAAVDSGRVVWVGTYGLSNVAGQEPVSASTPFMIASVSKTITATVLMSLHASGKFGLDDDINAYLPFRVRNPNHPSEPITFRQLLRHRSSLTDNREFYGPYWGEANGDPTTSLAGYLEDYLSPDGETYDPEENFLQVTPDDRQSYCNTCYALLGYLAQEISGEPFERLSEEVLFAPLGMTSTGWFLADFEDREPAMPYRHAADSGYVAYGQNGYPDWPAGQLRTTITDLSRFLSVYAGGGELDGEVVIDPSTIETLTPRTPEVGFHTWFQRGLPNGQIVYSHGGGDIGVRTVIAFRRVGGRGVIVLTNGEGQVGAIADEIFLAIDSLKALGSDRE
jgi:CubicO group peptidase (beta-lactamase class C family)